MVSGLQPEDGGDGQGATPPLTYTEQFHQMFPYYMSIGMTYDQYWNDDPWLVKDYRKADEMRTERLNQQLWLQGMYVYDAICCAAPILHAFAKKGTKPSPYPKEPYPITAKQRKKNEDSAEKRTFDKGLAKMKAFMALNNKRYGNNGGSATGGDSDGGQRNDGGFDSD